MGFFDIFSKNKKETLDKGLQKTKEGVFGKLRRAIAGRRTIDDEFLDELEEIFITSDIGAETTIKIIERIQARAARDKYVDMDELNKLLCEEITDLLAENDSDEAGYGLPSGRKPYVIMVVGVNGVGKTTTIGKLAAHFKAAGKKVVLGAADTFRAAAIEQLDEWGRRAGLRHTVVGSSQRCRCGDYRYRRPSAQQERPHGRAQQNQANHGKSRSRRSRRGVAGARRLHRTERF